MKATRHRRATGPAPRRPFGHFLISLPGCLLVGLLGSGCSQQAATPPAPPVQTVDQKVKAIQNNPFLTPDAKQHAIDKLQGNAPQSAGTPPPATAPAGGPQDGAPLRGNGP